MLHSQSQSIHKARYRGTTDPGAVGAGIEWLDENFDPPVQKIRNTDNDGWDVALDPADFAAAGAAPTGSAGGDLTGTYPNPTLAAAGTSGTYTKVTTDSKGRVTSGTTLSAGDVPNLAASIIASGQLALARGGTHADLSATGPGFLKQATSGADVTVAALSSGDIPNLDASKITSGTFNIARLASGTPDGTKFVRDDGTLAVPAGVGGGGTPTFSGVKLRKSSAQSISNNSTAQISFDTEVYDTDGYHEGVTHPTRITIPSNGYYRLKATVEWAANGSGFRACWLTRNGSTIEDSSNSVPVGGSSWAHGFSVTLYATAGDYFELNVYQNSGGSIDVNASNPYSPLFECECVGT